MAKLLAEGKDIVYPIEDKPLVIGRSSQVDITIHDSRASRQHCEIGKKADGYYLKDLESFNGTYINGKKVNFASLQHGDRVKVGKHEFIFALHDDSSLLQGPQASFQAAILVIKSPQPMQIELKQSVYIIGRGEGADISLKDVQISSRHAELTYKPSGWWICDLQSRNGVFVNNRRINAGQLQHGDRVRLGESQCVFKLLSPQKRVRRIPWHSLLLVGISAVIMAMALTAMLLARNFTRIRELPGNLIDDFSFEEVPQRLSWECHGQMQISDRFARSGKFSLMFTGKKSEQLEYSKAEYWDAVAPLIYGKVYQISAWLKYQKLRGAAGIKITWLQQSFDTKNERKIGESYSPLLTGSSSQWQQIEFIAYPPVAANRLRLSCFACGQADHVCFDDISLLAIDAQKVPQPALLEQLDLKSYLDNRGLLTIEQGSKRVLPKGKILVWRRHLGQRTLIATQDLACGRLAVAKDSLIWNGELPALSGYQNFRLQITYQRQERQLLFSLELQLPASDIEAAYVFARNQVEKIDWRHSSDHPKRKQRWIDGMIWQTGNKQQLGFFYHQPVTSLLASQGQSQRIAQVLPVSGKKCRWQMTIKSNLAQDNSQLEKLQALAQEYDRQGQLAKSRSLYQKIVTDFHFHSAGNKAQQRLAAISTAFHRDLDRCLDLLAQSRFFNSLAFYRQVLGECRQIVQRWEGVNQTQRLVKITQELESEYRQLQKKQADKIAVRLLARAQDLEKENYPALAMLFYQEIVDYYRQSESTRTAIAKIEELHQKWRQDDRLWRK